MAATGILQIMYPGDPTIRGLARLPTMMSAADVAQGAGGSAIARTLSAAQTQFDAFANITSGSRSAQDVPYSSGGTGVPTPPPVVGTPPIAGGGTAPAPTTGGDDCSKYTIGSWDWSMCQGNKAADSLNPFSGGGDWINRGLFGLMALVLVGFGLYLFAKAD
jgi:hypothetical protein